jgi:putative ABC transport system substrate-binding protein
MRRREFISLLGGAAAGRPLAALAQQPPKALIGSLNGISAAAQMDNMAAFRLGLGETGFVEGRNLAIEYRWADGHFDRMPAMAADLIGHKVAAMLVGGSTEGVRAVMTVSQTVPIVFMTSADPVAVGLVRSLNRPGGNATGVTSFGVELGSKRLELLHEVVPAAKKIAVLVNPNNPVIAEGETQAAQTAARRLGLEIIVANAGRESEIEAALSTAALKGAAALHVGVDASFIDWREQIGALALQHALPTMFTAEARTSGILMSYETEITGLYRQAGSYIGRILKGEKPGDLPVMQPTTFRLVINLKTAKAINVPIPESFLLRADEVIE